ncbi:MAG: hypothetical protein RL096_412, partial [Actinomycetota bacterium]
MIIVQFIGMIVFSIISGAINQIIYVPSVYDVMNEKT